MDDDAATRRHGDTGKPGDLDPRANPAEPVFEGLPADSASPDASSAGRALAASALEWLDAREAPPPPELRQRIAEALQGVEAETVPGALAEGALSCLQATLDAPEERKSALDLLAADALLTYALEAAAELGAATLRRMVEEYGTGKLESVLPEDEGR